MERKKVLLIDGGSRQVLPLIEGFHNMQWEVWVFCGSKLDVGYASKYTDKRVMGIVDFKNEERTYQSIKRAIENEKYDLVVPMIDFFATILSKHKEELSKKAKIYVNDWNIYSKAIDKLETMKICMEESIPCPKTLLVHELQEIDNNKFLFPIVIKPRTSWGAKGFRVVYSDEELRREYQSKEAQFGNMLIQEYIPQNGKQYQVELLIDKNGECKAFVLMDKVRWYPINGGSSTMNITIHDDTIKENCLRLMKSIGWRGYASIDLIEDPRDKIAKIMEINPRMNGTAKICFAAGVDLAKLIYEDAYDMDVEDQSTYKGGVGLRYFHMDVLWFLKSKDRFKSRPSWFSWKNTVDEIIDLRNIKPCLVYSLVSLKKLKNDHNNR